MLVTLRYLFAISFVVCLWMPFSHAGQGVSITQNEQRYYLNFRGYDNLGMQDAGGKRLEQTAVDVKLGLRVRYNLNADWLLHVDSRVVSLGKNIYKRENSKFSSETYLEIKRLYVSKNRIFGYAPSLSLHVGRQTFRDNNSWNYDTELDAVKLEFERTLLQWQFAYGGRLFSYRLGDNEFNLNIEDSRFLLAELKYQWYFKHYIGIYGLNERNSVAENQTGQSFAADEIIQPRSRLNWLGVQAYGERAFGRGAFEYSGTLAVLSGDTQKLSISTQADNNRYITSYENQTLRNGIAVDMRFIWRATAQGFSVGIGYASASGDDNGKTLSQYNQSGIASNKKRVLGASRYRYYGEALNPKLSNLHIITLTAGYPLSPFFWFESAYHRYRQDKALPYIDASSPGLAPNGQSNEIGQGLDFIFGGALRRNQQAQLILSGFWGGKAFDETISKKTIYRALVNYRVFFQ
ncbi:MAG TPA: hypothetical protein ENK04_00410 [Gammaproteobacteria bacterium]|nr:hypothetical protein [Gammaproteobacteria bacterium]